MPQLNPLFQPIDKYSELIIPCPALIAINLNALCCVGQPNLHLPALILHLISYLMFLHVLNLLHLSSSKGTLLSPWLPANMSSVLFTDSSVNARTVFPSMGNSCGRELAIVDRSAPSFCRQQGYWIYKSPRNPLG